MFPLYFITLICWCWCLCIWGSGHFFQSSCLLCQQKIFTSQTSLGKEPAGRIHKGTGRASELPGQVKLLAWSHGQAWPMTVLTQSGRLAERWGWAGLLLGSLVKQERSVLPGYLVPLAGFHVQVQAETVLHSWVGPKDELCIHAGFQAIFQSQAPWSGKAAGKLCSWQGCWLGSLSFFLIKVFIITFY